MGDVFDAMNRSRREREEQPDDGGSADSHDEHAEGRPESPALPLDDVAARPMHEEADDATFGVQPPETPESAQPVAAAVAKAEGEAAAQTAQQDDTLARRGGDLDDVDPDLDDDFDDEDDDLGDGLTSLNGYSADVVVHHDRGSVITEQYRAIRTQVLARARNRRIQTHVVTSSAPEEGKSVSSVNLGIVFSELKSQKTLLIEGDLRRPSFEKLFDRKCETGVLQLLRGEETDIDKALQPTVYDNLQFMPAGGKDFAHSTELLSSPRMAQLLDRLKDRYDHIFIDTPPVVTVTDACILGSMCDQTLLVVRLHRTPTEVVDRAKRLLRAANCEVAGVILTHLEFSTSRYMYRYGYAYTYT